MRVMITGGGTGGHISPAVAIFEELQRRDPRLMAQWVGRRGGAEQRVCERLAIPFRGVPVEGWPRGRKLRKLVAAAKLGFGVCVSALLLKRFKPHVVIGVGSYVSLPLGWAAQRLGVPTVIHEQNARLGMANSMLAPRAARVFLSYDNTAGEFPPEKAKVVGNPVRAGFVRPPEKSAARARLGLDAGIPVILITGGSQGAHRLNEAVAGMLPMLTADSVQLLWMTGAADAAMAKQAAETAPGRVDVFTYIDDMPMACAAADLIISRAGASSTAEIAALGKPSILIPYPHATDNHQERNARVFEQAGAAAVLLDAECGAEKLRVLAQSLLDAPRRLEAMGRAAQTLARPSAAEAMVEDVMALVFEKD